MLHDVVISIYQFVKKQHLCISMYIIYRTISFLLATTTPRNANMLKSQSQQQQQQQHQQQQICFLIKTIISPLTK